MDMLHFEGRNRLGFIHMTKNSTWFLKGIGIILMITHHLFWNHAGYGLAIGGVALSQRIGVMGKVCVALFLMLSGYGICKKYGKDFLIRDQKKRLQSLYIVYWICIVFTVVLGLLFFREQFLDFFSGMSLKQNVKNTLMTILGLQQFIGYQGIVGAWWFVSVIVTCYLIYPFLIRNTWRQDVGTCILLSMVGFLFYYSSGFFYVMAYLFPFFLGVLICKYKVLERHMNIFVILALLVVVVGMRISIIALTRIGYALELLLYVLAMYLFKDIRVRLYTKPFIFLGKMSAYIFYIHMLFSSYYTYKFVDSLRNPILMVAFVLGVSLLFAILLVRIERVIRGILYENMERNAEEIVRIK